jgi:DNA end-binding protein Ku
MVIMEDEELDAVALESTRIIDIEQFVPQEDIAWIWLDKAHYLVPDDPVAEDAYCVIRDAMKATGTVGIARLVLNRREYAVMLEPRDKGIILWTLRYGDEVREAEEYFADIDRAKPDAKALKLFSSLVKERKAEWSEDLVQDPVQKNLKAMIEAKKKRSRRARRRRRRKARSPSQRATSSRSPRRCGRASPPSGRAKASGPSAAQQPCGSRPKGRRSVPPALPRHWSR